MASVYGFRTTSNEDVVFEHLERHHGIDAYTAGERLHRIKSRHGMRGNDNVIFDLTGNVYIDDGTGQSLVKLGSLTTRD